MKKFISIVCVVALTLMVQYALKYYFTNNILFGVMVSAKETVYPEYADKIMGFGGGIDNKTIFPVRVKKIVPQGYRGMDYVTTLVTTWGFSEIKQESIQDYELLEGKILMPFSEYSLGIFFKFTGEHAVNPTVFEITYSILGINFKDTVVKEFFDTWDD